MEIRIEKTPTPDQAAIATLVSLMFTGTQYAQVATQKALPPTPLPPSGQVSGHICYPSENIPEMLAYFRNVSDNRLTELPISEDQDTYTLQLPEGTYVAYAWAPEYQVGGMYSRAVTCGLAEACNDHTPVTFKVESGISLENVDICDWVIPSRNLPLPPGNILPGAPTSEPPPLSSD